jgi:hypothetical protein
MRVRKVVLIMTAAMLSVTLARGAGIPGEIPFRLARGFGIVMQGGIGPLTNLNFLLDTGAVPSVLNQKVASRIRVAGALRSYALLHENIQAQYVTVDEVHFGCIRAVALPMVVVDLARVERLLGTRIDAIIGLDVFARQSFSIDYKRRKITLGLSGLTRHVLPVEIYNLWGAPYWVLPINLGGHDLRMLLDTGADVVAVFAGHIPHPDLEGGMRSTGSLTGEATPRALRPVRLVIGDVSLNKQVAVVLDQPPAALQTMDGLLSPTALRLSRIDFDWDHSCLRWNAE